MTRLTREQLLGYLLGALECKECEEIEQALAQSPEWTAEFEKIRRSLDTVGLLDDPSQEDPPLCLAARTCEFVEQKAESYSAETVVLAALNPTTSTPRIDLPSSRQTASPLQPRSRVKLSPVSRGEAGGLSFRRLDLLVAAAIVIVATALSFPAIFSNRLEANVTTCQNNLRQLGQGLQEYSELQPDGAFPHVPASGPRSFAGVFAPTLVSNQLISNTKSLFCPETLQGKSTATPVMPTLNEIDTADAAELPELRARMGDVFGFNLGYSRDLDVLPPRNSRRAEYALLGDAPNDSQPGRASANHGGRGQNMLFEDGRVKFVNLSNHERQQSALDDPYHNRLGQVAAGVDINDAVLGGGPDRPMPISWTRP